MNVTETLVGYTVVNYFGDRMACIGSTMSTILPQTHHLLVTHGFTNKYHHTQILIVLYSQPLVLLLQIVIFQYDDK